jgi:hypothetical protein
MSVITGVGPKRAESMKPSAKLRCRCGEVQGVATDMSARTVNHVVCYCDDCQAFAHHLGRTDLVDHHGGTDIVQIAPASMRFEHGQPSIVGVRLTPKGLYRWYARCCHTPLGNTFGPAIPFVGIVVQAFETDGQKADDLFGKPIGAIKGEYAIGEIPAGSRGIRLPLMLRAIGMVLGWRIRGRTWPHPYFEQSTRTPIYPVTILSNAQREALRPLCGPRPSAPAHQRAGH